MYQPEVLALASRAFSHLPWLVFFLIAGIWALFSLVAVYHFVRYGMGSAMMWVGVGLYVILSLSLISSMLYALSLLAP